MASPSRNYSDSRLSANCQTLYINRKFLVLCALPFLSSEKTEFQEKLMNVTDIVIQTDALVFILKLQETGCS